MTGARAATLSLCVCHRLSPLRAAAHSFCLSFCTHTHLAGGGVAAHICQCPVRCPSGANIRTRQGLGSTVTATGGHGGLARGSGGIEGIQNVWRRVPHICDDWFGACPPGPLFPSFIFPGSHRKHTRGGGTLCGAAWRAGVAGEEEQRPAVHRHWIGQYSCHTMRADRNVSPMGTSLGRGVTLGGHGTSSTRQEAEGREKEL